MPSVYFFFDAPLRYAMPRPPTFNHPLRKIREAADLTQPRLAALIGVTKDAVEKLENGRMAMSHEAAVKIRHQLGCHIVRKADRDTGKKSWSVSATIVGEDGRRTKYTKDDYDRHREMLEEAGNEDGTRWKEGLAAATALLVEAAIRAGHLPSVAAELEQKIAALIDAHKLESQLEGVLRDEHEMKQVNAKATARAFTAIPTISALNVLAHDAGRLERDGG